MTEIVTTYRAKGKKSPLEFLFKYDLNCDLKGFEIATGQLDQTQIDWLFSPNFPATEMLMKDVWMKTKKYTDAFEVEISPADISFEALWELYDYKVSKQDAMKSFNKLKPTERIKCFIEVPYYLQYLKKHPGIEKLYLSTYINKRRFEDERQITVGKVFNPVLHNLAAKKTDKQ